MNRRILVGITSIIIVIILLGTVYFKQQDVEPIKIGGILILTGSGSSWGLNSHRGADLAIEEINSEGGVNGRQLEIVYENNIGDDPRVAVSVFYKLFREGIDIMIGPNWSESGLALAPLACDKKVLMISPSLGVAGFNEECDYVFNLWPHDSLLSVELGKRIYDDGYRTIAILGSQQAWEQEQSYAVKSGFENSGGEVISFQLPSKNEVNFSQEIQNIIMVNPEAIVITAFIHQAEIAKKIVEARVTLPIYLALLDVNTVTTAEGSLEEAISITSFTPNQEFIGSFVNKYGVPPDIGSDTSYDAIKLIAKAIEETGSTDPTILKDYINQLDYYEGVSGNLVFDGKGGVTKVYKMLTVKNDVIIAK
ncbi:hypothetical protein A3K80_03805 [Candidatus Bathyarchaeota archaeon RBG_13_38_9]|nr:MAG: hypothetical protein A3K80_03805 [Candidatus Bathyarchaeota archaeon RBG_13_38_9]